MTFSASRSCARRRRSNGSRNRMHEICDRRSVVINTVWSSAWDPSSSVTAVLRAPRPPASSSLQRAHEWTREEGAHLVAVPAYRKPICGDPLLPAATVRRQHRAAEISRRNRDYRLRRARFDHRSARRGTAADSGGIRAIAAGGSMAVPLLSLIAPCNQSYLLDSHCALDRRCLFTAAVRPPGASRSGPQPLGGRGPASVPPPDYTIGRTTSCRSCSEDTEITSEVVVRPDGRISLPLLKDVQAAD